MLLEFMALNDVRETNLINVRIQKKEETNTRFGECLFPKVRTTKSILDKFARNMFFGPSIKFLILKAIIYKSTPVSAKSPI